MKNSNSQGTYFKIHITGHLDKSWSDWLAGLEIKQLNNGETMLAGHLRDQAELMGILNKLYSLNLILLSVNEVNQNK